MGEGSFSMAFGALVLLISDPVTPLSQCVLYRVMLNDVSYQLHIQPFNYKVVYDALSENEQKLRFS